jgi:hypothetical protein
MRLGLHINSDPHTSGWMTPHGFLTLLKLVETCDIIERGHMTAAQYEMVNPTTQLWMSMSHVNARIKAGDWLYTLRSPKEWAA